jgi:hypothetical protein
LLGRATSNDLATTFARETFNAPDDRCRIDDKKVVRPFNNGSDSALLCVAVSMRETFGAENVV